MSINDLLSRHSNIVIAASALLVGAALWALLVTKLGLGAAEAALITGLALLSLAQLHVYRDRVRVSKTISNELEGIMATTHDLLSDVAALRDDVGEMRKRIGEKNFLHADKIAAQVGAMEAMIERLEATHEERTETEGRIATEVESLAEAARQQIRAARTLSSRTSRRPAVDERMDDDDDVDMVDDADTAAAPAGERKASMRRETDTRRKPLRRSSDIISRVTGAITGNRIDLYLQPIVTLPQRKVRYYEALTRLRDEEGHIIMPSDYLPAARDAGVMTEIDNTLLFRSISLVRRLAERKRDVGVFCNIAAATLLDSDFFPQFIEFMEANTQLAPTLVFEFAEPALDALGPLEEESLNALAAMGFRFSVDHVKNLDIDFEHLASLGFRFVKVDASVMLDSDLGGATRVHPEDMAKLAARYGIELIAEKIEAEKTVVNILDYDVRLAQGYLFARPRLVREEGGTASLRAAA